VEDVMGPFLSLTLNLKGHVPSKKNSYRPKKGGKGFYKDDRLQAELDRLAMQIPGEFRDLNLISPAISFTFTYTKANWDRDNAVTALLDILVSMSVIKNDNLASCNGRIVIEPAVRGEDDGVVIVITPCQ
jgi:Holliday junction resolvase RusA-like endonuclease